MGQSQLPATYFYRQSTQCKMAYSNHVAYNPAWGNCIFHPCQKNAAPTTHCENNLKLHLEMQELKNIKRSQLKLQLAQLKLASPPANFSEDDKSSKSSDESLGKITNLQEWSQIFTQGEPKLFGSQLSNSQLATLS